MKTFLLILSCFFVLSASAQVSIKVMYHNLLNFPSSNPDRYTDYRVVLQYAKPDVYVVNELDSEIGADLILDSALNVFGNTQYQRATFVDGYDTDNGLFYNSDKLGLVNQLQLGTVLRDISVYRLYYKAPNLTAQTDTIYFWFFSCHLKAGISDFEQRNQEALQIKYYLNDIAGQAENVFVGGDFNFYSGFESGCQSLLNQGVVPLIDPVNAIGNWSGDWAYSNWHTQSTRTGGINGGSGGGMDDRFDLILVSEDVFDNSNGAQYISGTYTPLGQDGNHFNSAINSGVNNAAPDSVIQALYWGSDHLPVMMTVALDETALTPNHKIEYVQVSYNAQNHSLSIVSSAEEFDLQLFDLSGRLVFELKTSLKEIKIPHQLNGVFIWSIIADGKQASDKIVLT